MRRITQLLLPSFAFATQSLPIYSNAVNKIIVYRTPEEAYSYYLNYDATIAQLKQTITASFPHFTVGLSTNLLSVGSLVDNQAEQNNF